MKRISKTVDFMLSRTVIFVLAFIWCRYYINSLWLSPLSALGITVLLSLVLFLFSRSRKAKKDITAAERKHMEQVINEFMYSVNRKNIEFFYNLIKDQYPATLLADCLLTENNKVKTLIFTHFTYAPLSEDALREIFILNSGYKAERIIVFTNSFTDKTKNAAALLDTEIILMNAENTYSFLKEFNMYPVIILKAAQPIKRKPIKTLLKFAFAKSKAKAYLLCSAVMLFCSFIVPYNLYYLIFATITLIFSLICFIDFKFKQESDKSLL